MSLCEEPGGGNGVARAAAQAREGGPFVLAAADLTGQAQCLPVAALRGGQVAAGQVQRPEFSW